MSELGGIYAQLGEINKIVTATHTNMQALIGNGGQTGRIPDIEDDIKSIRENDIKDHAAQLNRIKGALAILVVLMTLLGGSEAWVHLLKK